MDDAARAGGERCPAHVLGAANVHGAVVVHRAPDVHHGREVHDRIDSLHRSNERLRPADVAAVDRDAMVLEPARVLVGERQHPHAVAPSVQRRDEVPPHEAVAAGDEDPHRAAPAVAAHVARCSGSPRISARLAARSRATQHMSFDET